MQTVWQLLSVSLTLVLLLTACQPQPDPVEAVAALPEGDPTRGETLFAEAIGGTPTCISCHLLTDQADIGPGMAGYGDRAGSTVPDQSAEVYSYVAIMNPADHIVAGYGNVMYSEYRSRLNEQQVADLIAYMLEQ